MKKIFKGILIIIAIILILFVIFLEYSRRYEKKLRNEKREYDIIDEIVDNNPYDDAKEYLCSNVRYEVPTQNDMFDRLVEAGIASEEDYKGTFIYIGDRYGEAVLEGHYLIIHFVYNGDEMTWDLYDPDSDTPFELSMSDEKKEEFMEILEEEFLLYKTRKKEAIDVNMDGEIDGLDKLICALFTCGLPLQGVYYTWS